MINSARVDRRDAAAASVTVNSLQQQNARCLSLPAFLVCTLLLFRPVRQEIAPALATILHRSPSSNALRFPTVPA